VHAVLQVLEKARQDKVVGSSLEARVVLYVEDESLRSNLREWDQQPNTADPLKFIFIVSQVPPPPNPVIHIVSFMANVSQ